MKKYAIYNIVVDPGENITDRFREIVDNSNNKIDNFYYNTIKECYLKHKDKFTSYNNNIWTVMYCFDNNLNYPYTYQIIDKKDIFEDFPICDKIRDNI